MEALQMLKFALKKERLNFMQGWITLESLMCDRDSVEGNLLSLLLREEDAEDVLDQIICDFGEDDGIA
jgi:hypothetical protein